MRAAPFCLHRWAELKAQPGRHMSCPGLCSELQTAYSAIPEFVALVGYPLPEKCEQASQKGLWMASFSDSSANPYVAFAAAYDRDGGFYLWLLGVRPDARGAGLSRDLVNCFLSEGKRRGHTKFTALVHSGAPGMAHVLEAAGFTVRGGALKTAEVRGVVSVRTYSRYELRL